MASALQWVLKLATGGFTGPANAAAKSVDGLNSKLRATQTSVANFETQHKHAAFRWNKGVGDMTKAQDKFDKSMDASNGGLLETVGGLAAVEAAAIAATAAIAAVGVALLAKGASMAVDATAFRENSIAAFKVLLGSQQAALSIFEKADELAGRLGIADEQVIAQLKKLVSVGFSADQALGVVKAAADVAAIQGEEAGAAFAQLIATMEAKGKFDTRALNQLAKLGIKTDDIYSALAKKLGKTTAEVQALIKAGKVDTKDAMEAILATVQGKFGGAADEIANSIPRMIFRIQDAIGDLFNTVDTTAIKEALDSVLTALSGPAGEKIREGLNKIFGGLFDALFGALDQGRVDAIFGAIGDALNMVGDVILTMAPSIAAFIGGMIDGFSAIWPVIKLAGQAMVGLANILASIPVGVWKAMGYGIVIVVGALLALLVALNAVAMVVVAVFVGIPLAIIAALGWVVSILDDVWNAITGFVGSLYDAGANMISGLVDGILSGASAVIDAIVGVATSAIDAAKSALGIASPSKIFEGFGQFTSLGFAQGIGNDNSGAEAMGAMVEPPSMLSGQQAGRAAGRSASAAAGGAGGASITIENLVVQSASGSPEDTAAAIESALTRTLERMQIAVGA